MFRIFDWWVVKAEFFVFVFTFLSVYFPTNHQNFVFGNTTDKGKRFLVDVDEVRLITG